MSLKNKIIFAIFILFVALISWYIGSVTGQKMAIKGMGQEFNKAQQIRDVSELKDLRRLKMLVEQCPNRALKQLDLLIDADMKVMSTRIALDGLSADAEEFINEFDKDLVPLLHNYKSKYGNRWPRLTCDELQDKKALNCSENQGSDTKTLTAK